MVHGIPQPPFVIGGKYDVESVLGQGGMGVVYLAKQRPLNRKVAIKMVLGSFAHEPTFLERFKSEAALAAHLSHPGIVGIHDVIEYEGTWCLVLEYVHGHTVESAIDSLGRLPEKRALHIAAQVADALDFCHRNRIVHRDIKPANIMLVEGDRARLMDFGVAKAPDSGVRTQTGMAIGTPKYMSPEQAQGLRGVDGRSDIYALGCVLFEMVTGRVPFDGPQSIAIAIAHIQEAPPRPMWIDPTLNQGVDALILRCLEKKPDHRYPTAAELAKQCRAVLADLERAEFAAAHAGDQIGETQTGTGLAQPRGSSRATPSAAPGSGTGSGIGGGRSSGEAIGRGRASSGAPMDLTIEDESPPPMPAIGAASSPEKLAGAVSLAGLRETGAERRAATMSPEDRKRVSGAETNVPGAPGRPPSAPVAPSATPPGAAEPEEFPDGGTALMDQPPVAPPFEGQDLVPPPRTRTKEGGGKPRHLVLWVSAICVPLILLSVGIALGPTMATMLSQRRAARNARPTPAATAAPRSTPIAAPTAATSDPTPLPTAASTPGPTPTPAATPTFKMPERPEDFELFFRTEMGKRFAQLEGAGENGDGQKEQLLWEAEHILDEVEKRFPNEPMVIGHRGIIMYNRGKFDLADDYLTEACERLEELPRPVQIYFGQYQKWAQEKRGTAAERPSGG